MFAVPFFLPQLHWFSLIAAIPFFYIIVDTPKKIVKYSVFFSMSFYLAVFTWIFWMYPMEHIGVTPMESLFIVIAGWIGFSIIMTFVFLILPLGLKFIGSKLIAKHPKAVYLLPILAASLYVILEWVQSWFLTGLPWTKLAVAQYRNLFFIQSMSVFGTYFPAFLIILINASIAVYILHRRNKTNFAHFTKRSVNCLLIACIIVYAVNFGFGFLRLHFYERNHQYETITAQIVQGNIPSYERWIRYTPEQILRIYEDLTEWYTTPETTISVWPETAVPRAFTRNKYDENNNNGGLYNRLRSVAKNNDITLISGVFYRETIDDTTHTYNAIMAFDANYEFIPPYIKRQLVPFGEFVPFENVLTRIFPFIENIALFGSSLTAGDSSRLMYVNSVNYGGLVCFDSIFARLARRSVKDGADILIISTNDSWFRDSRAIYQHNAQAVLRAVQNNRYVVRSANTGISSFISSTGRILQQTEVFERVVITQEVGLVQGLTIYTRFGEIILYLAWIFVAVSVVLPRIVVIISKADK